MTRRGGGGRIFFYNWPVYACTWGLALAVLAFVIVRRPSFGLVWLVALCALPLGWSALSLAVSHYIYDRSPLVGGAWMPSLFAAPVRNWATIHAGLDAEIELDAVMPGTCVARLDVFDARVMTSPSIGRARTVTKATNAAQKCPPTALALADESCDAIVVAFTAHEIRDAKTRERFFAEVHRILRPEGRMILVEHLRDAMNFAAFGPGFLHFVARREWLRLAVCTRLAVARETRITPWIMVLAMERAK